MPVIAAFGRVALQAEPARSKIVGKMWTHVKVPESLAQRFQLTKVAKLQIGSM